MSAVWICVARSVSMATGCEATAFPCFVDLERDVLWAETRLVVAWAFLRFAGAAADLG